MMGPGPDKRGDRGIRRTVERIEHGGGDGGELARSPPGGNYALAILCFSCARQLKHIF
jgi:hypothetical protein